MMAKHTSGKEKKTREKKERNCFAVLICHNALLLLKHVGVRPNKAPQGIAVSYVYRINTGWRYIKEEAEVREEPHYLEMSFDLHAHMQPAYKWYTRHYVHNHSNTHLRMPLSYSALQPPPADHLLFNTIRISNFHNFHLITSSVSTLFTPTSWNRYPNTLFMTYKIFITKLSF